jgi:large subunit ribosomal protein L19
MAGKKTTTEKSEKTPKSAKAVKVKGPLKGHELTRKIALKAKNEKIQEFRSGDTVGVYVKVKEGEKERVQLYRGIVIKVSGAGPTRSFTVRKMSSGIGVERTFPFGSPIVDRVETINRGTVRRSRLYYLRSLRGKAAKIESELVATTAKVKPVAAAKATEVTPAE